ncbi:unnamed protein product [marine sediment metagenome]|uniref:aspartate kinase n=1 Tax=marine sediment metagenome TaxID=412755 RepID=X1B052_9ZZZZ
MAIHSLGWEAISFTGMQAGIVTNAVHTRAKVTAINHKKLKSALEKGKIVIVAGFQGIDANGDITTLGRGGSDTTAIALAAQLEADGCEIYTDVDGVYTADPRIVRTARRIPAISYDEMAEMANLGARVMHYRAIDLARNYKVKIIVKSSFIAGEGTLIKEVDSMLEISISNSRSLGEEVILPAILINSSVVFPIAETTTTTLLPSFALSTIFSATFFIRSIFATELPPYFCTIILFISKRFTP